ncbi:MAG: 30S ribosomal protein S17e [Candidatus Bathyarchaeia archaeon]
MRIKRVAKMLVEKYPGKFSNEFGANKAAVAQLLDVKSKKIINQIAGYITQLKRSST